MLNNGEIMENPELTPKGDGTYIARTHKRADGSKYVKAEYKNVDKWCNCSRKDRYCTNVLGLVKHKIHICSSCGSIMKVCKVPSK